MMTIYDRLSAEVEYYLWLLSYDRGKIAPNQFFEFFRREAPGVDLVKSETAFQYWRKKYYGQ